MGRTARDVLNELRWREGRDLSQAEIWVADRTRPEGTRRVHGTEILSLGHRYFTTATATIPFYKVQRILVRGQVVFDRAVESTRT